MKKITILTFFFLSSILMAQDEEVTYQKWLFKAGANIVDNSGDVSPFNSWDLKKMGFSQNYAIGLDYRFHRHWSAGLFISNNKFVANRAELDKVIITKDIKYFSADVNVKYYLWAAEKESNSRFNMYLSAAAGSFKISENTFSLNVGGGLMYWLNDSFGVNLESAAKWALNGNAQFDTNHFQHFAGIIYRHSGKKDSDNDGVIDAEDKCPNTFGTAEYNGCPDSDNDGIIDIEDNCPELAGLKVNKGCPDTDNDGVMDVLDKCVNTYGPKENKGCTYRDTDNDGILDKDDNCPNVKGVSANNGCPTQVIKETDDLIETTNKTLENFSKIIYFETGKHQFKSKTEEVLNGVIATLNEHHNVQVVIEGHTDASGNADTNHLLSQQRADVVKKYLVKKGVNSNKIRAIGYGQNNPIASNNTKKGRALNRRVIIKIK